MEEGGIGDEFLPAIGNLTLLSNPLPSGPFRPPCPTALGLIGPRKKEKKTGFDDVS